MLVERLVSPELRVALSPSRAYAEYVRDETAGAGAWIALRRPLFVALIQGVAIAMSATNTVAAPVVASVTAYWATTVVVQAIGALVLIGTAPARPRLSRAIDLFFLGHAPWSLWLLVSAGAIAAAPSMALLRWIPMAGMIVPAALTPRIVAAFDRTVLGSSRGAARRRTVVHQAVMWTALIAYVFLSIQLWPRAVGMLQ